MKKKKGKATFELLEECNFPEVFECCSKAPDSLSALEQPDAQIGHIQAFYDGYKWKGFYFPCRNELRTSAFDREIRDIYQCLVTQLHTLKALRLFCERYPKAKAGENEYHFFMNGHAADYWIRFITGNSDCNLYLKAYTKKLSDRLGA